MSDDLRAVLEMLDLLGRDALRRVLIHDQADRDAIAHDVRQFPLPDEPLTAADAAPGRVEG